MTPESSWLFMQVSSSFEIKNLKAEKFVLKLISCLMMARQTGSVSNGN